jgi:hypothetical protein
LTAVESRPRPRHQPHPARLGEQGHGRSAPGQGERRSAPAEHPTPTPPRARREAIRSGGTPRADPTRQTGGPTSVDPMSTNRCEWTDHHGRVRVVQRASQPSLLLGGGGCRAAGANPSLSHSRQRPVPPEPGDDSSRHWSRHPPVPGGTHHEARPLPQGAKPKGASSRDLAATPSP